MGEIQVALDTLEDEAGSFSTLKSEGWNFVLVFTLLTTLMCVFNKRWDYHGWVAIPLLFIFAQFSPSNTHVKAAEDIMATYYRADIDGYSCIITSTRSGIDRTEFKRNTAGEIIGTEEVEGGTYERTMMNHRIYWGNNRGEEGKCDDF